MKYLLKGCISREAHEITSDVRLPTDQELVKSLISPAATPYLVQVVMRGETHKVKIAKMEKDPATKERLVLYGYVQQGNVPVYKNNHNWFGVREQD